MPVAASMASVTATVVPSGLLTTIAVSLVRSIDHSNSSSVPRSSGQIDAEPMLTLLWIVPPDPSG